MDPSQESCSSQPQRYGNRAELSEALHLSASSIEFRRVQSVILKIMKEMQPFNGTDTTRGVMLKDYDRKYLPKILEALPEYFHDYDSRRCLRAYCSSPDNKNPDSRQCVSTCADNNENSHEVPDISHPKEQRNISHSPHWTQKLELVTTPDRAKDLTTGHLLGVGSHPSLMTLAARLLSAGVKSPNDLIVMKKWGRERVKAFLQESSQRGCPIISDIITEEDFLSALDL